MIVPATIGLAVGQNCGFGDISVAAAPNRRWDETVDYVIDGVAVVLICWLLC